MFKIAKTKYLVIEVDPTAEPWKNYAHSGWRSEPPMTYVEVWQRWWDYEPENVRDWEQRYELGKNYSNTDTVLSLKDGELIQLPSKYAWNYLGPCHFMDDKYLKTMCKREGLKYQIFGSLKEANRYCVSLGYPRIGGFKNARPHENHFVGLEDGDENYIQVYEVWDENNITKRSLKELNEGE